MLSSFFEKTRLVKSLMALRKQSHLQTRLQLRDELAYSRRLMPWLAAVYVLFGFVDAFSTTSGSLAFYLGLRVIGVLTSWLLYLVARGRTRYGVRIFFAAAPYFYVVEYIMISRHLSLTPYFAGLALLLFTTTTLFPMRGRVAFPVYGAAMAPVLVWAMLQPFAESVDTVNFALMSIGTLMVCVVNSDQAYRDYLQRLIAKEALARDLGKREKEVRIKTEQLLKRRTFESQFSPQVVSAVLNDSTSIREMQQREIAVAVIDIENSTVKAKNLSPQAYKEVVEEVFDVFSSTCLKWNVTVDKFTGDGAQALAGAPVGFPDSVDRALAACADTIRMLSVRKEALELLWRGELNIRFAVAYGSALVGFLGRGTLKSFTAIGETVSFTHRLCSTPAPWCVALSASDAKVKEVKLLESWDIESRVVTGLKGFGADRFTVRFLRLKEQMEGAADVGRCPKCQTPLMVSETPSGLPKLMCPGCEARQHWEAA